MFETNLTGSRTRKLELLNLRNHGMVHMGQQGDYKYIVYKFSLGETLHFEFLTQNNSPISERY